MSPKIACLGRQPPPLPGTRGVSSAILILFFIGFGHLAAWSTPAQAQIRDPSLRWRTIETQHFAVHYYEPLGLLARRTAVVAERAHRILVQVIGHQPRERTHIVLTDPTDDANGSATVLPYNVIRLYATAPDDLSPLGDYDDWLTELIVHEHTHIVHLDQIGGIPALLNMILGKVFAPNNAQPRWFIEGLATQQESEHTAGGRLRSSMFDMFLRMDALEGRLLDLDQLSNSVDRWPHGHVWYLYGSRFVDYIRERFGRRAVQMITREYGSQLIPYGLNRICLRATGHSFDSLYDQFLKSMRNKYSTVQQGLTQEGLVMGQRLTHHGEEVASPRFISNTRMVYHVSNNRMRNHLRELQLNDPSKQATLIRVAGTATPSPHPDQNTLIFSATEMYRDIYRFFDLFEYDRAKRQTKRLTHGWRAREPDVSPDGRQVTFVLNGPGTSHLAVATLANVEKTRRLLVRSRRSELIYTPRWAPDGKQIAYSQWSRGGYRDIWILDLSARKTRRITHDRALDTGPTWSPDGRTLYFSSDRTGIANIFAYDMHTERVQQVTNVVGGAYQPVISPDGRTLVYVGYTGLGFDLYRLPLQAIAARDAEPYKDTRPPPSDNSSMLITDSKPYDPSGTILPRAYTLDLQPDAFGQQLGINFEGSDAAQWHAYAGRLGISLTHGHPSFDFRYYYQRWPLRPSIGVFRFLNPGGGLQIGGENRSWIESRTGADLSLSYVFPRNFHSETLTVTQTVADIDSVEDFTGDLNPNTPPPVIPSTGLLSRLTLGWNFSNVERYVYDISASRGRAFGFAVSLADPLIGSEYESVSLSWSYSQYVTMPWQRGHVWATRYGGGISGGDIGGRGVFAVGGFPQQALLDALIDGTSLGGVALRGYPAFYRVGSQFHLLQNEYRFLILRTQWGLSTLPFYLNRLYGAVFVDTGNAYYDDIDFSDFLLGTGGELLLDFTVGYFVGFTLRVGIAQGLTQGGDTQPYVNLGFPF